jgi:POT family proton-dependent oligopeptide transporter
MKNRFGSYNAAFAAASGGLVLSVITFASFQRFVRHADRSTRSAKEVEREDRELTPAEEKGRVVALLVIFSIVILFWMAYYQNGYTLSLWARDNTTQRLIKDPENYQTFNPLFIVTMTPLLLWSFARLAKRGLEPSTPAKIGIGMLLTGASCALMGFAGLAGGDHGRVSPAWLIGSYWVITMAELCLSPIGLSLVSKTAPPRMRGAMMGVWFAATGAGGYLSGAIGRMWEAWPHSTFFFFLTASTIVAAILLRSVMGFVKRATAPPAREMAETAA